MEEGVLFVLFLVFVMYLFTKYWQQTVNKKYKAYTSNDAMGVMFFGWKMAHRKENKKKIKNG